MTRRDPLKTSAALASARANEALLTGHRVGCHLTPVEGCPYCAPPKPATARQLNRGAS